MGKTEKSRPPVYQTEERQADKGTGEYTIPRLDISTNGDRVQGALEKILPKGAENAVSTLELLRITGLNEARTLRKLISDERADGAVILSSERGYFRPDDGEKGRAEAEAFVATVMAKGVNTVRAANSAKAFLSILPGQTEIGGGVCGQTESGC